MWSAGLVPALRVLSFSSSLAALGMDETPFRASRPTQFRLSCSEIGKGMGLSGGVCKLIQENLNDEKYPPLFQLNVIWYVRFCLAVEIKCDLQIAPTCNIRHTTFESKNNRTFQSVPVLMRHKLDLFSYATWVKA